MKHYLLATLAALCISVPASAGEIHVGAGYILNNINMDHKGWLVDVEYRKGPVQVDLYRVNDSLLGTELTSTVMYRTDRGRWNFGIGVMTSMAIEVPEWWVHSGSAVAKWGWGLSGQCLMCGEVVQVGRSLGDSWEIQLRYQQNERFLLPSHNGAMIIFTRILP